MVSTHSILLRAKSVEGHQSVLVQQLNNQESQGRCVTANIPNKKSSIQISNNVKVPCVTVVQTSK